MIDVNSINVEREDWIEAMKSVTPASHRSAMVHAAPLKTVLQPVLGRKLTELLKGARHVFPSAQVCIGPDGSRCDEAGIATDDKASRVAEMPAEIVSILKGTATEQEHATTPFWMNTQRSRLLICGPNGSGQAHMVSALVTVGDNTASVLTQNASWQGGALLQALEAFKIHAIGLPSLVADAGARCTEEALVNIVAEARHAAPAILYLPHLEIWWETAHQTLKVLDGTHLVSATYALNSCVHVCG